MKISIFKLLKDKLRSPKSKIMSPGFMTPDVINDFSAVGAEWLIDGECGQDEFREKLVSTFSLGISEYAVEIFERATQIYQEELESVVEADDNEPQLNNQNFHETEESVSGDGAKSPDDIIARIDDTKPLESSDVWAIARAFIIAGKRGDDVITETHTALLPLYPALTRREVGAKFTDFGKAIYPNN